MTNGPFGNDEEDKFRGLVGDNWGKLESAVGREAYEAQVAMQQAQTDLAHKHAELLESQRQHGVAQGAVDIEMSQTAIRFRDQHRELVKQFTSLVYFITVLTLLGGFAVVVYLWRWALGVV